MNQTTYTKVKQHRGRGRIWIEGARLAAAGFHWHERYRDTLYAAERVIVLELDANGPKAVAGRRRGDKEIPIIDLCNAEILNAYGEGTAVRVDFLPGRIVVSVHHEQEAQEDRERRILAAIAKHSSETGSGGPSALRTGGLCFGGGIASAAIHASLADAGVFATLEFAADVRGDYLDCAVLNNPAVTDDTRLIVGQLEEIEPSLIGPADLVQVSLPCTGHSKSGKSKNQIARAEDHATDATAIIGALTLLRAANPAVVVFENVREAADSATYALLRAELVRRRYNITETVLDETHAGSIERRARHWMVATSAGLGAVDLENMPKIQNTQTVGDVLDPDAPADMWADNSYLKQKAESDAAAGKGFKRQLITPDAKHVGCINRHYWKRQSTPPMLTRADGKERLFTPAEHARMKGIPPELVAGEPNTRATQILGQSVLWQHAQAITRRVLQHLQAVAQPEGAAA